MSKVAHYLQEHVSGEVLMTNDARKHFSTDNGIFSVVPSIIMYPRNEYDVRKTARFAWQLAERGRLIPLTARGQGGDTTGAAIGSGIVLVFPAHMNQVTDFNSKSGEVTVEPGVSFAKLQQTLETHDRFVPSYPSSWELATAGGAIANAISGEMSAKYGGMRQLVKKLRVVLANGEVIETCRLNNRELNKKLGMATFEGEIYRALDKLLEEHTELIKSQADSKARGSNGYDIWDIKQADGSFDLTPLFVGSQGTLGIITEAVLATEVHNSDRTVIAAYFDDFHTAEQVLAELHESDDQPSRVEVIDGSLLKFIEESNPNLLTGVVDKPLPKLVLVIECDDNSRVQKKTVRKITKVLSRNEVIYKVANDDETADKLTQLLDCQAYIAVFSESDSKPLPLTGAGTVPIDRFKDYLDGMKTIIKNNNLKPSVWGQAAAGRLQLRASLDLAQVGDRQKVFKIVGEYCKLVSDLGGKIEGEQNDGRLLAPYLKLFYGDEIYGVFEKVKEIFDPYGIMNPGVKIGVDLENTKPLLRHDYTLSHLYDYLPRS